MVDIADTRCKTSSNQVTRSLSSYPVVIRSCVDQRGIHDIEKQFVFKNNPQFIFHDSPGFEAGNDQELKDVLSFVEKRSKMNNPNEQLHAIWSDPINIFLICNTDRSCLIQGFVSS